MVDTVDRDRRAACSAMRSVETDGCVATGAGCAGIVTTAEDDAGGRVVPSSGSGRGAETAVGWLPNAAG